MAEGIESLPLHCTWLDDIVEIMIHQPNGVAEVEAIVNAMMRTGRDVRATPNETITRRINNYCSDANDTSKKVRFDLFERVSPGTYRLCGWPERPNLIDIQNIKFDDPAYQIVWELFFRLVKENDPEKVKSASNRRLLEAFTRSIKPGGPLHDKLERLMQRRKRRQCQVRSTSTVQPSS